MRKFMNLLHNNKMCFCLTLIIGVVFSAVSIIIPVVSGDLVSVVAAGEHLVSLLSLYLVLNALNVVLSYADQYSGNILKTRIKHQMRERVFRSFLEKDDATREEISEISSFINNDIPSIAEDYFFGTIDIVKCVCLILFASVSLVSINWSFALIILGCSILTLIIPKATGKKSGLARKEYSESLKRYNTGLQSILGGISVIKTLDVKKYARDIVANANDDVKKKQYKTVGRYMIVYALNASLQILKNVLILCVGVYLIIKGHMEVGGLIAVIQLASNISAPIEVLAYILHSRNEMLPLVGQYEEKIQMEEDKSEEEKSIMDKIQQISLEQVSCRIGEVEILKDISACFEAGKKYLIMGSSGSGKTTLLKLLARIGGMEYDGRITCDEKEIKEFTKHSFYKQVGMVFQETYLFHATLEENILLGRDISRERYQEIIEKLNLGYLISRYSGQEITPEIMEKLSGGERQRVGLARVMVGNPVVYLLDEVTSALDTVNSELVERLLLEEDALVIHVCHKPNRKLADRYDGSYRMEAGRLSVEI